MIFNQSIACLLFSAAAVALNAPGASADESAEDVFAIYEHQIHPRPTGVYEEGERIFFHSREKIAEQGRFAKQKAARAALNGLTKKVFSWIDGHMDVVQPVATNGLAVMQSVGGAFCTPRTAVHRRLSDIPMRILHRDVDKDAKDVYVLDMAFLRKDLLDDAVKGRFETRPTTVVQQWRSVVHEQLSATNRMAFSCAVGAFDLWTIESCRACGVRELMPTSGQEIACCRRCIDDLAKSVEQVDADVARQYVRNLIGMENALSNELASASWFVATNRLGLSILSFGSCLVDRQDVPDDGWDIVAAYGDQTKDPDATCAAMASLLVRAPGSEELWRILGIALLRGERPHAAAACFRMALRIWSESAETLDALARAYEAMGCPDLARGAAVVAFGLSKEGEDIEASRRILGLK